MQVTVRSYFAMVAVLGERGSALSELECCGDDEVERIAKDVGVSAAELREARTLWS